MEFERNTLLFELGKYQRAMDGFLVMLAARPGDLAVKLIITISRRYHQFIFFYACIRSCEIVTHLVVFFYDKMMQNYITV